MQQEPALNAAPDIGMVDGFMPSSILCFTLQTEQFREKLAQLKAAQEEASANTVNEMGPASLPSAAVLAGGPGRASTASDLSMASSRLSTATMTQDEKAFAAEFEDQVADGDETKAPSIMSAGPHIKMEFTSPGRVSFFCKVYFATQFDRMRQYFGVNDWFAETLAKCSKWDATGGKSGSSFLKTKDNRLILKQISRPEMDAFMKFAASYFDYVSQAVIDDLPTILVKVFGLVRVGFREPHTGKHVRFGFVVMENLFYGRKVSRASIFVYRGF